MSSSKTIGGAKSQTLRSACTRTGQGPLALFHSRSRGSRILVVVTVIAMLLTTAFTARNVWLPFMAHFLIVNDKLEKADAIVVLSAGSPWRNKKGAELYHKGLAPKVITLGDSYYDHLLPALGQRLTDAELNARVLTQYGVPRSHILPLPGNVEGTYDEALILRRYIESRDSIRSIMLVTSGFHSRRAKWIFQKVFRDRPIRIMAVEAESPSFNAANWWQHERSVVAVFNEYIKFAYYWLKWGP